MFIPSKGLGYYFLSPPFFIHSSKNKLQPINNALISIVGGGLLSQTLSL